MRKIIYAVLAALVLSTAAEAGAAKRTTVVTGTAPTKTAAGTVRAAAMTEDIYVEIKAHEAAFLAASFMKEQNMQMDTAEDQQKALQFAQAKQNDFEAVKKMLLARYGVQEKDFNAYETRLNGESWNQVNTDVKDIDLTNLKIDGNTVMNEKARQLAERISTRAQEIESAHLYK